ncbi:MAG: hemerythrin domain-containing protein [Nocardioides sp.]|nr:hemerythrin domain-containing protein [Nocardioides sp.]
MSGQTIGQVLEDDHHRIDRHFAAFAASLAGDGAVAEDELAAGITALKHHIWVEEELHFPPLRAAGLMGPIMVMLKEHGELWDLLDRLEAQVAEAAAVAEISATWQVAAALLEAHNAKEEQILYPSGDQVLDTDTAADIQDCLVNETTPEGWVAQMAGRTAG